MLVVVLVRDKPLWFVGAPQDIRKCVVIWMGIVDIALTLTGVFFVAPLFIQSSFEQQHIASDVSYIISVLITATISSICIASTWKRSIASKF